MKKRVNIFYISRLFDPLFSLSDDETDELASLNPDNELQVKVLLNNFILGNFNRYGQASQSIVKATLLYLLCYGIENHDFSELFPYGDVPINAPKNKKLFFTWLWEVLFPNEDSQNCADEFIVENNYNAPNSVFIK